MPKNTLARIRASLWPPLSWQCDSGVRVSRMAAAGVFGLFLGYYGLLCFRHDWGGDFRMYCAGVARLQRDLTSPLHEAMNAPGTQSTVYTLYLFVVGAFGKLAGATPYRSLQIAGVFNLAALGLSIGYFFSRYSLHKRPGLPAACFVFCMLLLRWQHFGWSSETSLLTLQYTQAYPSTLAWALALSCFGLCEDYRRERRPMHLIALGLLSFALLATHPITGSWVMGIVGLFGLFFFLGKRELRPLLLLLSTLAIALVCVAPWPHFGLLGQGSLTGVSEPSKFGASPLADLGNLYVAAFPAAAWLLARRRHAFWVLAFVATLAALGLWRVLGISFGNRYSFFAGFFAQFCLAEVMALGLLSAWRRPTFLPPARAWPSVDRPLTAAVPWLALLATLPSPMLQRAFAPPAKGGLRSPSQLLAMPSPHDAYYARFARLAPLLDENDVVLMPVTRDAFDLASTTGASVVSAPNAFRVPDWRERLDAVRRFFLPKTSSRRRRKIAREQGATRVLVTEYYRKDLRRHRRAFGQPAFEGRGLWLFDVPPDTDQR